MTAQEFSDVVRAIATLLWPTIVLVLVVLLRKRLASLIDRIQSAKFPGVEIVLRDIEAVAGELAVLADEAPAPLAARLKVLESRLDRTVRVNLPEGNGMNAADRMALEIQQETLNGVDVLDSEIEGDLRSKEGITYRYTVAALPDERRQNAMRLKAKMEGICIEVTDGNETIRVDLRKDRSHLAH